MSRQNKVNPGMYTQRGRLTQDDAARELARQRAIGSEHTWQPVQRNQMPHLKGAMPTARTVAENEAADDEVEDDVAEEKPKPRVRKTQARAKAAAPKAAARKSTRKAAKVPMKKAKAARSVKPGRTSAKRRKS